jgi:hypothetical protein
VEAVLEEEGRHARGAHAAPPLVVDAVVGGDEGLPQRLVRRGLGAKGGEDCLDAELAGHLAGGVAAHAVADHQQRRGAGLPAAVGVLVDLASHADVRARAEANSHEAISDGHDAPPRL